MKEVKARKIHQCFCCCGIIQKDEKYFIDLDYAHKYCNQCTPWLMKGFSFRETRIKAFGSPILRGWLKPNLKGY